MRRTTKRVIINLGLFCGAIVFILFLNRSPTRSQGFPWNTVRYKTTARKLPEPLGICPGLAESTKPALVVSHVTSDGDTAWLNPLKEQYHLCLFEADSAPKSPISTAHPPLRVPANRAHEAMAYLTFLIDNYAAFPASGAVFVHGSRWAWHNDAPAYDNAAALRVLNVSSALAPAGYHNLRCDWAAGTCGAGSGNEPAAPPQGSLETALSARLEPWNARAVSDSYLPQALAVLFGQKAAGLGRADRLRAQCCAQFVVARENVWAHSREEYVALRQWVLDSGVDAAPMDDRVAGRILSYVWHILFLGDKSRSPAAGSNVALEQLNELACPSAQECYCRLYGKCDLTTCSRPGHCRGEYVLPPDFSLPKDWAATHS